MDEEPTEKKASAKTYLRMAALVALAAVVVILVFGRTARSEFSKTSSVLNAER